MPVDKEGKQKGKPTTEAPEFLPILNMRKGGTIRLEIFNDALEALDKKFTKTEQQSVAESEKEIGNLTDALVKHTNITKEDAEEIVYNIIKERYFFSQTSNPYIRNATERTKGIPSYSPTRVDYTDDRLAEAVAREIKPVNPPVVIAVETQGSADIINGIHSNTRTQAQNDVEGQSIAAQDLNDAVTTSGTHIVSATNRSGSNVTNAVARNNNITIMQQPNNPLLFQVAGTDPTSLNC